jgi:hypothetical protein
MRPLAHGLRGNAQLPRYLSIGAILLAGQHDSRAQRERLQGLAPSRPLNQAVVLVQGQGDRLNLPATSHNVYTHNAGAGVGMPLRICVSSRAPQSRRRLGLPECGRKRRRGVMRQ